MNTYTNLIKKKKKKKISIPPKSLTQPHSLSRFIKIDFYKY